jgi:DNA polymerase V
MIGLMDCNNFFASCERLFRPDLLKKPVAVLSSNDGCIVARSQEVKDLGIPMGIPYFKVKDICEKEGVVLFSSNFALYRDISSRVMQTLASEVGLCEIYSIDEAFFEIDDAITHEEVLALRSRIMQNVGLPVSIGIASTKTLAKQASSIAKKTDGTCILTQEKWDDAQKTTLCSSVWGLGRQTSAKLCEMGVTTVAEFLSLDSAVVRKHFGVSGDRIRSELQGISVYEVEGTTEDLQQSIMSTQSFEKTTNKLQDLESAVAYHVSFAAEKLREKKLVASRLHVAILASKHGDFFLRDGSSETVLSVPTSSTKTLLSEALRLVRKMYDKEVPYKKAGVVLGGLMPESYVTGDLFSDEKDESNGDAIDAIADTINGRFGHGTLRAAVILENPTRASAKLRSKEYTTQWKDIPSVRAK